MRLTTLCIALLLSGCAVPDDPEPQADTEPSLDTPAPTPPPEPITVLEEHVEASGQDYHRTFSFDAPDLAYDVAELRPDGEYSWTGEISIKLIAPDGSETVLLEGEGGQGAYGSLMIQGSENQPAKAGYQAGAWQVDVRADGIADIPLIATLR